ncbi:MULTISPECIES: flagellar motor protein MotB [unclassified Sphingomonas]|jgi:chemotaxis protein MotB|uniref:flagellar motor protein MotB n=1 Tax=unclassified Sphingomonas TaxID=196159 RepID=UPI002269BA11|nr:MULTISPECIES: flagellar motor protein MotB [unclassified Sphingomonas]
MARAAPHGANQPPKIVIVKKIIQGGHAGHHGGAWKVAYADFVTAMMAFFLLLWLLGATNEKQRKGIADYFAPTILDKKSLGLGGSGVLGGESVLSNNKLGPKAASAPIASMGIPTQNAGGQQSGTGDKGSLRNPKAFQEADMKAFGAIRRKLEAQIAGSARLSKLASHVRFVPTQDGLRIDLVDDADYSMFALGTTALDGRASELIGMIAGTIANTPNTIMIRGHTDSVPYGDPRAMNNWMLSSGRAEATRRRLASGGIPEQRFERIEGVADREPLITSNAMDPRNRRVAITLLYRKGSFGS